MKSKLLVVLTIAVLTHRSLGQTMIKGHRLGETAQQFLQIEPEIAARLDSCVHHEHIVLSVEIDKMSDIKALLIATTTRMMLSLPNKPNRDELKGLADQQKVITIDEPDSMNRMFCYRLVTALATDGTTDFSATPTSETPIWIFSGGKLVQLSVSLSDASFSTVEAGLSKRIGVSPIHTEPPLQNVLGARWNDSDSIWLSSELFANLHESNNPASPSLKLMVQTRALYDQALRKRALAPNPLD